MNTQSDSKKRGWRLPFLLVWGGQAFSLIGSALVQFALIWWITIETGSPAALATATAVGFIPTIFLGPLAGPLVDRWSRKWVLVISDGLIAFFTAALGLLFWLGLAEIWHVYVIMFLRSLGDAFQKPAMMATTPLMVPKAHLTRVAGMNRTLEGIVRFIAPPFGAVLLSVLNVQGVLFIDISTAALAILPLLIVAIPQPKSERSDSHVAKAVLRDFRDGFRYIWRKKGLRFLIMTNGIWGIIVMAPWLAFPPLLVKQHFGLGAMHLGLLHSAGGISMIAGGALLTVWGGFKRRIITNVLGVVVLGAGMLTVGLTPANAFWLAVVGWSVICFAASIFSGASHAIYQSVVAPRMLGRFFSLLQSIVHAMTPISMAIAGPLAEVIGVQPFYVFGGIGAFVVASIRFFTPSIRNIEDQTNEQT